MAIKDSNSIIIPFSLFIVIPRAFRKIENSNRTNIQKCSSMEN